MPLLERLPVLPGTTQWPVWGTTARVVVTGADDALPGAPAERARRAEDVVRRVLAAVDATCSRFRDDSELVRAQHAADRGGAVEVSPLLADLVREALRAARRTGGDVDPTLGDAMCALGYDRDLAEVARWPGPGGSEVAVVRRSRPGWAGVALDGRRLRLPAGTRLDLGASAKAVAADRAAAAVVADLGGGALVALGGDVATAGAAPAGGWRVLVSDGDDQPEQVVALRAGTALATSSTRSRRWRHGTREMHHVLDPRTLLPAAEVWRTASVAAADCATAGAAATAALVRGERAPAFLRGTRLAARLVAADGSVLLLGPWPDAGATGASGARGAAA